MRILCCGDQHLTDKRPKNRIDNYATTVLWKLKQELEIAEEEKCDFVVFPGDVFNTFRENHFIVQEAMKLIRDTWDTQVLCVAGQHDQEYHTPDLKGTALQTLINSSAVTLLGSEPFHLPDSVAFYGASWKDEIPKIDPSFKTNILVIHKMFLGDDKLWEQQEGHTWTKQFLMKHKFDLIIAGDNHTQFVIDHKGRYVVNLGSLMRSTIAQINHHPAVAVYDTQKRTVDIIDLEVTPIDQVMRLDKVVKEKERNEQLEAFVASLKNEEVKDGHDAKLDFVSRLEKACEDKKETLDPEIIDIIKDALQSVNVSK